MNNKKLHTNLLALFFCGLSTLNAWADARQDAHATVERLHRIGVIQSIPDELKSVDATLATADKFYNERQVSLAERFYLLTLQKSRIIMASLPNSLPDAPDTAHQPNPTPPAAPEQTAPVPGAPESSPALPPKAPSDISQEADQQASDADADNIPNDIISDKIVGSVDVYTVTKGDTIKLVAAKLGVGRQHLLRLNKLPATALLKIGQKLTYNNRKIIPQRVKNGIIINIPDRTLYYFKQGKLAKSLPVALGVAVTNEKYDWKTPTGKFKITAKMKDPTWYVPPSIQSEMEEQGKEVIISIPPGPTNPLGKFAMKTSLPNILIHSTTKPWSIYSFASHGCIRVYPEQMEDFFNVVKVNTPGEIIYKPVKLAVTEHGKILLEVHHDIYGKSAGLSIEARKLIEKQRLAERVDWKRVDAVIKQKAGIAEDISL